MGILSRSLALAMLFGGGFLFILQLRSKWPGWIGLPLLILIVSAVRDIGLTPLAIYDLGLSHRSASSLAVPLTSQNMPPAMGLLFVGYVSIAGGMILSKLIFGKNQLSQNTASAHDDYSSSFMANAWRSALVLFLVGILCNGYMLASLLRNNSLFALAINRAFITDETVVFGRFYLWANMFAPLMQMGALGMLLFSNRNPSLYWVSLSANLGYLVIQVLLGSRLSAITHLILIAFVFHYGIRRIRFGQLFGLGITALASLFIITWIRFGAGDLQDAFLTVLGQLLVSPNLDTAAFALSAFPNRIPFLGGEPALSGLLYLFPSFNVILPRSFWYFIAYYMFGGRNPSGGIGGEHYAFPAEHYMAWGYGGVVLLSLLFGVIYGIIFEWQSRRPRNLFLLILAIGFNIVLFRSYSGKMAASLGGTGFGLLLPVGLWVALTIRLPKRSYSLITSLLLFVFFLLMRYLTGQDFFDYLSSLSLIAGYIACIDLIGFVGRKRALPFSPVLPVDNE